MDSEELANSYGPHVNFSLDNGGRIVYAHRQSDLAEKINVASAHKTDFEKVREFHYTYGQPVGTSPQFLDEDRFELRKRLIQEEFDEFLEAIEEGDLTNAFKELADLVYVVQGTAVEMGGRLDKVFDEVHASNMSKLDENGEPIYREDGKVLKSHLYRAPDIDRVLYNR